MQAKQTVGKTRYEKNHFQGTNNIAPSNMYIVRSMDTGTGTGTFQTKTTKNNLNCRPNLKVRKKITFGHE